MKVCLPLMAEALAHGELFLRDITRKTLTISHGFGKKERWFRSGEEEVAR
jgi:hypothetical protein